MKSFRIVFLGTGVSTAIPNLRHVLDDKADPCPVCHHAITVPQSKNRRNNVALAITFVDDHNAQQCIMIDAGKTMRDACLNVFPKCGIRSVTALLITHDHADAILGLDDLRDLQQSERVSVPDPFDSTKTVFGFRILSGPLPIYLTDKTLDTIKGVFPYLTAPPKYLDEENCVIERRVACIDLKAIPSRHSMAFHGLIDSFPVYHGGTYVSLGFHIGEGGQFVYISDVKVVPDESYEFLKSLPQIEVLVVDCLDREGIFSHFGFQEAIDFCKSLNPRLVYLTGMCCGLGLHDDVEQELQSLGLNNYHVAYDGMEINFP